MIYNNGTDIDIIFKTIKQIYPKIHINVIYYYYYLFVLLPLIYAYLKCNLC